MTSSNELRVLQFCYGYEGPYLDSARQYANLFKGTPYKVTTVFLTGRGNAAVANSVECDEVLFMEYSAKAAKGFKFKAIREFRKIAATRDFKLCITHRTKPSYIACMATDLPVISIHHTYGDFKRLSRRAYARVFRSRLNLLAVSNSLREDIERYLPDWPSDRLHTLYNRINVDAVEQQLHSREDARDRLNIPNDAWVIGTVGRLHPDKDQAVLLRSFAAARPNLPSNSLLVICGKGRLEQDLKSLASQLNIASQVLFTGQILDARRLFRAFDVFVLSSAKEPFGMVLLEAMTAEIPVICSDGGGASEVVCESGLQFIAKDAMSLAGCLVRISEMDEGQLAGFKQRMRIRLNTLFSDSAARERFWSLPVLLGVR